jgi:hypothetical protein
VLVEGLLEARNALVVGDGGWWGQSFWGLRCRKEKLIERGGLVECMDRQTRFAVALIMKMSLSISVGWPWSRVDFGRSADV